MKIVCGVLAVGLLLISQIAAAESSSDSPEVQEVVVTAQRRSETVQNVPMSITALTGAALEQQGAKSFFDYAGKVPALAFGYSGDGVVASRSISIRGISGTDVTGFYIDETPVPDSVDPRILDVARIEVLRGPQGTLYGARSMAGTVRVITEQPDANESSGRVGVSGSYISETSRPSYGVDGSYNLPLIPNQLALRMVGFYGYDAGFFKRRYLTDAPEASQLSPTANPAALGSLPVTTVDNVAATQSYGGSISLVYDVSDALRITPRFMYQDTSTNGFPYYDAGSYPVSVPATTPSVNMHANGYTQDRFYNVPERAEDKWTLVTVGARWRVETGELTSSTSYFVRRADEVEDETDFLWQSLLAPFAGVPLPSGQAYQPVPIASSIEEIRRFNRFTQEIRFVSQLAGRLQYTTGIFFSTTWGQLPGAAQFLPAYASGISQTAGFATVGIPVNPANPDEIFALKYDTRITEPAVYGEVSYKLTDDLGAVAGLRAYEVDTSTSGYSEGIAFGGPRIYDPRATLRERGVNPKFEMDYHVDPGKMVYVLVARGFRPGGLVPSVPTGEPLNCQLPAGVTAEDAKRYHSDYLWNYELGSKTEWYDRRLTVNGSVYLIRWNAIQQFQLLNCGFGYIANAGQAQSRGFDLDMHGRPFPELDLSAGIGYQHARITAAGATSPQQRGDRVYQVPDWTGNIGASWTIPLSDTRSLVSSVDYSYVGNSTSANNDPFVPRVRPSYGLLNAHFQYAFNLCTVALIAKNLTNVEADLSDSHSLAAETVGRPRLIVNQPRSIGIEFKRSF